MAGENNLQQAFISLICLMLLLAGCEGVSQAPVEKRLEIPQIQSKQGETVRLALRFEPNDVTTYKVVTQKGKDVEFEGPSSKEKSLTGGHNDNRTEITFSQEVLSVDEQGNGVLRITIKDLKMVIIQKDRPVLDFDSGREKDRIGLLGHLPSHSYTIKVRADGRFIEVVDANEVRSFVKGRFKENRIAMTLFTDEAIARRHGCLVLPAADKNELVIGDTWSRARSFSFDMMGSKSYEKIYALREIKKKDGQKIAEAAMNAIPAAGTAELQSEGVSEMFDNIENYQGKLQFDLSSGKTINYSEKLRVDWIFISPATEQQQKEPDSIKMGVLDLYSIERID